MIKKIKDSLTRYNIHEVLMGLGISFAFGFILGIFLVTYNGGTYLVEDEWSIIQLKTKSLPPEVDMAVVTARFQKIDGKWKKLY